MLLREAVPAEPTWERFDVKVRGNVIPKRAMIVEIGATLVTDARPLTSVHSHMILEIGRPNRRVRTVRTGVQDHSTMDLEGNTTNYDDF